MKQSQTSFLLAVFVSTIAVSAQQGAGGGSSPADVIYAQAGQLVDVGGFGLNLYCMGSGSPTVVFDSGWEDWAPAWSTVQPQIARWTRACSYDRAGAGFSDPGPMPRSSVRIATELHTALHRANIAGPYILVGNAFGGDNARTFADLYMGELRGWSWMTPIPTTLDRRRCKRINISERLRSSPGCAIVVTQLPGTSRCRRSRRDLASHNGPVLSSFFGAYRKRRGL
jgi:pimeloyl-ACP methyl ester carboxylesterase